MTVSIDKKEHKAIIGSLTRAMTLISWDLAAPVAFAHPQAQKGGIELWHQKDTFAVALSDLSKPMILKTLTKHQDKIIRELCKEIIELRKRIDTLTGKQEHLRNVFLAKDPLARIKAAYQIRLEKAQKLRKKGDLPLKLTRKILKIPAKKAKEHLSVYKGFKYVSKKA